MVSSPDLTTLLRQPEGQRLEFKRRPSQGLDRDLCSLANTEGGVLLVGVEDDGSIVGIGGEMEEQVANLAHSCDPPVRPTIRTETIQGRSILVVEIPRSPHQLHRTHGEVYVRVGSTNRPLTLREILSLAQQRGLTSFDGECCEGATVADFEEAAIRDYLARREQIRGEVPPDSLSREQLLVNLGAAQEVEGTVVPTYAGILFFSPDPQRWWRQATVRCARFRGTTMGDFLDRQDLFGPLPRVIDQAVSFVERNVRLIGLRQGIRREEKLEYPLAVVREALCNAVAHRDYYLQSDVRIGIFDDRIEVHNPGLFPEGTTPDRPAHIARNPILCQLLYDVGLIERWGSGILLMRERMQSWDLPEPTYDFLGEVETVLTLTGPGPGFGQEETVSLEKAWMERQARLLAYLRQKSPATISELAGICPEVSKRTVRRDLQRMVEAGLILRQGDRRGTRYSPRGENLSDTEMSDNVR